MDIQGRAVGAGDLNIGELVEERLGERTGTLRRWLLVAFGLRFGPSPNTFCGRLDRAWGRSGSAHGRASNSVRCQSRSPRATKRPGSPTPASVRCLARAALVHARRCAVVEAAGFSRSASKARDAAADARSLGGDSRAGGWTCGPKPWPRQTGMHCDAMRCFCCDRRETT